MAEPLDRSKLRGYEDQFIWDALFRRLLNMIEANAELGYVIDPKYPSPEVFDRPGWKKFVVPTGDTKMIVVELEYDQDDYRPLCVDEPPRPQSEAPKFEHTMVKPLVEATVEFADGETSTYGVSFLESVRTIYLFKWPTALHLRGSMEGDSGLPLL